ncbi:MAG TPA: geranylgeranyl reductase family protein [Actinomycetaceae bacterium]|nr:geranylgeranyl reductase family protein [Actinomycetaceae bacterium]
MTTAHQDADVLVVGAGPAGSAAGHYLARLGHKVIVLEKSTFPRDKVCGDGLTPGAVRELIRMGVPMDPADGWMRNKGLRVIGGGHEIHLPWPETHSYPNYGMAKARTSFDETLARHAQQTGAELREGTTATAPILNERSGRILGVRARGTNDDGTRGEEYELRAPIVIEAGGVAARIATAMGVEKDEKRPMGVAVRTYFRSPRHDDEWMESQLELWDGPRERSNLLPGYGWIFALGDGSVNVGLGSVSSTARPTKLDYKDIFRTWMRNAPESWEFAPENQLAPLRSAALPMAFNRQPLYGKGLILVGDAGGMISPFNGEGIAYALMAGRIAADVSAQALARANAYGHEKALRAYPDAMKAELGGYYSLGRVFVKLIEHPSVMRVCTKYGLPRPTLMRFVHKLLSDGYERRGGETLDRLIVALSKVAPAA